MCERMEIQSHKGPYSVVFDNGLLAKIEKLREGVTHFLVDANVARLYADNLGSLLSDPRAIVIDATEENKSITRVVSVIEKLVANQVRRDHVLVAIGGGIIQDITCFIASTLLRGLAWKFVPTTLLAQADSCIGSKSSINLGVTKNILGTFYPPKEIFVSSQFLNTLDERDMLSGIGEIIKVHVIEGPASFDKLAADYWKMRQDRECLMGYVRSALDIKKKYIELDEFDRGVRNIFNYGHSFGHAIESATDFRVPHGIAVTIGMDMANHVAEARGILPRPERDRMHETLRLNYQQFGGVKIPLEALMSALLKDKKNTADQLVLILPKGDGATVERMKVDLDSSFRVQCQRFLEGIGI